MELRASAIISGYACDIFRSCLQCDCPGVKTKFLLKKRLSNDVAVASF